MQDQIIAGLTCFGGNMDVNCQASLQTLNVSDDLKWTTNTHVTPFTLTSKAYLTMSMVLEDFFAPSFFYPSTTRPPIFLPVQNGFYPSK